MDSILFRLVGVFTDELRQRLLSSLASQGEGAFGIAIDLTAWEPSPKDSASDWEPIVAYCQSRQIVLAGFPKIRKSDFVNFPLFSAEAECKSWIEAELSKKETSTPSTAQDTFQTVNCPNCGVALRIRQAGDHLCPNCQHKFSVNLKGWTRSYERLL